MGKPVVCWLVMLLLAVLGPLTRGEAAPALHLLNGLYFGPCVTQVTGSTAKILWVMMPGTSIHSRVEVAGAKVQVTTKPLAVLEREERVQIGSVSGLEAGRTYSYKLSFSDGGASRGEVSGTFQTPPPADATTPLHFVIYGDSRSYPERHRAVAGAIAHEDHLAFVLHTGDYTDYASVWPLWKQQFFDPAEEMLRGTTFWPTLGNHEEDGELCRGIFDMPASYYSFDYGNAHFAVLDSELEGTQGFAGMLAWLEKDLSASKALWKIVAFHRGTFDITYYRSTFGQKDLLPIFEKYGVDMVMNGHNHNYQRFRPIGTPGKKPIIFVVSAGGGAPSYPIFPSPILEKNHFGLNYCAFTIVGNTLEMTAKTPEGAVIDRLTLQKTAGFYQKEVMDRALSINFAQAAAFLLSGVFASVDGDLAAGGTFTFNISPLAFPQGTTVEISSAAEAPAVLGAKPRGRWAVSRTTLTGWQGRPGVDEAHPDKKYAPLTFTATAPPDFKFPDALEPALVLSLRVTYKNQTYSSDATGVYLLSKAWLDYLKERGL